MQAETRALFIFRLRCHAGKSTASGQSLTRLNFVLEFNGFQFLANGKKGLVFVPLFGSNACPNLQRQLASMARAPCFGARPALQAASVTKANSSPCSS